jgi:hypothetical protein
MHAALSGAYLRHSAQLSEQSFRHPISSLLAFDGFAFAVFAFLAVLLVAMVCLLQVSYGALSREASAQGRILSCAVLSKGHVMIG